MKRWPIVRHLRWLWLSYQVECHYRDWAKLGALPSHRARDEAALDQIWKGEA